MNVVPETIIYLIPYQSSDSVSDRYLACDDASSQYSRHSRPHNKVVPETVTQCALLAIVQ